MQTIIRHDVGGLFETQDPDQGCILGIEEDLQQLSDDISDAPPHAPFPLAQVRNMSRTYMRWCRNAFTFYCAQPLVVEHTAEEIAIRLEEEDDILEE